MLEILACEGYGVGGDVDAVDVGVLDGRGEEGV